MFRKAKEKDLSTIAQIYKKIHDAEQNGLTCTGWLKGIYPIRQTAEAALERGDLFIYEENDVVLASAIINRLQGEMYGDGQWMYSAETNEIMVLHTLTVDPEAKGRGIGSAFVKFYETYAQEQGCSVLRMDTNAKNSAARSLYAKLGYREADVVPCEFNGIPNVQLVLLEKQL